MWPFRKKSTAPKVLHLEDQALADLSQMFLNNPPDPTPGSDELDLAAFDYSVQSLKTLDKHLERIRSRQLSEKAWSIFVLRCGAYVGEVIRRHSPAPKEWHWLDYKQAAALVPFVASLGMSVGTAAVLWDGNQGVIFPCAKVGKYIQNGPEDSVFFYAQVIIAGTPPAT